MSVFSPQGANAVTALPTGSGLRRYGTSDTWVQDCDATGGGGTILDAAFFNNIIGNLNEVIDYANLNGATINDQPGNMQALRDAIIAIAGGVTSVTAPLVLTGGVLSIDIPALKVMTA